jgi:hypothetical protein
MQMEITFESNSKDFWKLYTKTVRAEMRRRMTPIRKSIISSLRSKAAQGHPGGKKAEAGMPKTYKAQRMKYGRFRMSLKNRSAPIGAKAKRQSGTFVRNKITHLATKKTPFPAAFWGNFLIRGTKKRYTKKGYHRGRILPNPLYGAIVQPKKGAMMNALKASTRKASETAGSKAKMERIK